LRKKFGVMTGKCPSNPALQGGMKGHNIIGNYPPGKRRPLGGSFASEFGETTVESLPGSEG